MSGSDKIVGLQLNLESEKNDLKNSKMKNHENTLNCKNLLGHKLSANDNNT